MRNRYRAVRGGTDETMAEESCRPAAEDSCCGPHVFTSVLLGVLACVLMTGGVFLAFHRWDPLWLIVSGVGVILVLIGSILHCCRNAKRPLGGCCLPEHLHNHVVLNGGSLAEQLLPLTNARSVSQLSLNMLPGYFPPVVTTYGIEQHSAVVQNINRIIHQPGKNLILLSLPGNTPQANIQNLVSQLEGSVLAETSHSPDVPSPVTTSVATPPLQTHIPILKNAEVQTCAAWPLPTAGTTSPTPGTSSATNEQRCSPVSTQTAAVNLMDCSPEPICDMPCNDAPAETEDIPTVLVDVSGNPEIPEPSLILDSLLCSIPPSSTTAETLEEVLVDISETPIDTSSSSNSDDSATEHNSPNTNCPPAEDSTANSSIAPTSSRTIVSSDCAHLDSSSVRLEVDQNDNSENSSLSLVDADDNDSIGRSSPPPSYEDVALQGETPVGVFGLAYGTL